MKMSSKQRMKEWKSLKKFLASSGSLKSMPLKNIFGKSWTKKDNKKLSLIKENYYMKYFKFSSIG